MSYHDYLLAARDREFPEHAGHGLHPHEEICALPRPGDAIRAFLCVCAEQAEYRLFRFETPLLSREDWERKELAREIANAISERMVWWGR